VNLEGTKTAMIAAPVAHANKGVVSHQAPPSNTKEALMSTGVTQPDGTVLFPANIAEQLREDERLEAERSQAIQRAEKARVNAQQEYLRTAK
jgi:hypothetical protein